MSMHWSYADFQPDSDLEQGDILQPTRELIEILKEVHAHFVNQKYTGYMIATQTCDLVRRKSSPFPKAKYISLVVIRPMQQVYLKLIGGVVDPVSPGVSCIFAKSGKFEAKNLFKRIVNQNEQSAGVFYIAPDVDWLGIGEPSVAMLRVSVSLKSDHYSALVRARVGRLAPAFQAKLGWLIGNLYNRPATPDWGDYSDGEKIETVIDDYLDQEFDKETGRGIVWLDDVLVQVARSKNINIAPDTLEQLKEHRPPDPFDVALKEVREKMNKVFDGLIAQEGEIKKDAVQAAIENTIKRLRNSGVFKRAIKKQ